MSEPPPRPDWLVKLDEHLETRHKEFVDQCVQRDDPSSKSDGILDVPLKAVTLNVGANSYRIGGRVRMKEGFDSDYGGQEATILNISRDPNAILVRFDCDNADEQQWYQVKTFNPAFEVVSP